MSINSSSIIQFITCVSVEVHHHYRQYDEIFDAQFVLKSVEVVGLYKNYKDQVSF